MSQRHLVGRNTLGLGVPFQTNCIFLHSLTEMSGAHSMIMSDRFQRYVASFSTDLVYSALEAVCCTADERNSHLSADARVEIAFIVY